MNLSGKAGLDEKGVGGRDEHSTCREVWLEEKGKRRD
jgi:hypothetical protein